MCELLAVSAPGPRRPVLKRAREIYGDGTHRGCGEERILLGLPKFTRLDYGD
jgi:hypothetical protein